MVSDEVTSEGFPRKGYPQSEFSVLEARHKSWSGHHKRKITLRKLYLVSSISKIGERPHSISQFSMYYRPQGQNI